MVPLLFFFLKGVIMFKKTIEYTDYNGVKKTEDFWFNLNQTELTELALSPSGGLDTMLKEVISSADTETILKTFKKIILMAYGKKTPDGRFTKRTDDGRKLADNFEESVVFPKIFMEVSFDADKAIEFINGCVPPELKDNVIKATTETKAQLENLAPNELPTI